MRQVTIFFISAQLPCFQSFSQNRVAINSTEDEPVISAMRDIDATNKGIPGPRMTKEQRLDIASPVTALSIFQTNTREGFYFYDGTSIGTGFQNTLDIVAGCSEASLVVQTCNDLVLKGYSDWHLQCKDELNKLYLNINAIGGFASSFFCSSSELSSYYAWVQDINNGGQASTLKPLPKYVRAVRAF